MAPKKTVETEKQNLDPWAEENYVEVYVPKRTRGEQATEFYSVNGNKYFVPKGKTVKVPAPIAELVKRREEQIMKTMEEAEKVFKGSAYPVGGLNVNTTRNI